MTVGSTKEEHFNIKQTFVVRLWCLQRLWESEWWGLYLKGKCYLLHGSFPKDKVLPYHLLSLTIERVIVVFFKELLLLKSFYFYLWGSWWRRSEFLIRQRKGSFIKVIVWSTNSTHQFLNLLDDHEKTIDSRCVGVSSVLFVKVRKIPVCGCFSSVTILKCMTQYISLRLGISHLSYFPIFCFFRNLGWKVFCVSTSFYYLTLVF